MDRSEARYFNKRLSHIKCIEEKYENTPLDIRKAPIKVRSFTSAVWSREKKKITKSKQYQDMRIEIFRMLKESDNWLANTKIAWEVNKLLDLELKPKQVSFLIHTIKWKEKFNIETKRSTNPYENLKRKGCLGKRSEFSTFPVIRTFYKLIKEYCPSCGSSRIDALLPLHNGKKWRCFQCGEMW